MTNTTTDKKKRYDIINNATGEIKTIFAGVDEKISVTADSTIIAFDEFVQDSQKKRKQVKKIEDYKHYSKTQGGFTMFMYNSLETIEKQLGVKNGDIARLMYLSTFIGWCDPTNEKHKGYIRIGEKNSPRHANDGDIKSMLKLSADAFRRFKKRLRDNDLLMKDEKGYYLSEIFWNGYANQNNYIKKGFEHTKIHRNAIRNLYENVVTEDNQKSANDLSIAMQIIPFVNFNTNMLSLDDPYSENPRPLTLTKLADTLDMTPKTFKRKLLAINSLEKEYIAVFDTAVRKRIVVNTELFFSGDIDNISQINRVFNAK